MVTLREMSGEVRPWRYDCEDVGSRLGSGSDPRYDWPWCLVFDLSTTGLGRFVLPPGRVGVSR